MNSIFKKGLTNCDAPATPKGKGAELVQQLGATNISFSFDIYKTYIKKITIV
jgi:hypothetical protein